MSSQILDCAGARRFSSFGAVLIPTGRGGNDSSRSRARCVIVPLWDGRIIIPKGGVPSRNGVMSTAFQYLDQHRRLAAGALVLHTALVFGLLLLPILEG